jgi:HAD superfamily hydrolase (TIGR01549 family)
MTPLAVIFDLDGTLVDTNAAHIAAWREAFAVNGLDVSSERLIPEVGKGGDQLVPAILGKYGEKDVGDAIRKDHDKVFRRLAYEQHFRVFPGVHELVARLRAGGLRTVLATSSKPAQLLAIQDSAGLDLNALVDLIVTSEEVAASKPAPDLLFQVLDKVQLGADRCLMVGDTTHDVQAAWRAGVACIGLLCGGCADEKALHDAGARSIWKDPADLLEHLDEAVAGV